MFYHLFHQGFEGLPRGCKIVVVDLLGQGSDRVCAVFVQQTATQSLEHAGRVAVHACRGADVSKRRGQPPGEVTLDRWRSIQVQPLRGESLEGGEPG